MPEDESGERMGKRRKMRKEYREDGRTERMREENAQSIQVYRLSVGRSMIEAAVHKSSLTETPPKNRAYIYTLTASEFRCE